MGNIAGGSNRWSGTAYRNEVALLFHELGHTQVTTTTPRTLTQAMRKPSDLTGLPVSLVVRAHVDIHLSEMLRDASSASEHEGTLFGAAVQRRRGYPVEDSYLCMTVADFIEFVLPLLPQAPSPV